MRLKIQTCILEILSSVLVLGFRQFAVFELKIFFISIKWEINVVCGLYLFDEAQDLNPCSSASIMVFFKCAGDSLWIGNLHYFSSVFFQGQTVRNKSWVSTFLMRRRIWTHILLTQWGGLFQVCQCWGLCFWADNLCYLSSRIFCSSKSKKISNVCLLC